MPCDQAAKALAAIQLTGCKAVTSAWIYVRRQVFNWSNSHKVIIDISSIR